MLEISIKTCEWCINGLLLWYNVVSGNEQLLYLYDFRIMYSLNNV